MARSERSAGFILFCRSNAAPQGVEYLLLDYGRHFDYVKGHVNPGESDLDAAHRELLEETGIADVRVIPGFANELVYFFRDRKTGLVRKTVVFFLAECFTRDVTLSHEHTGFTFLPYEAALRKVTFAGAKQVLKAAHEHLCAVGEATGCQPELSHPAQESTTHSIGDDPELSLILH